MKKNLFKYIAVAAICLTVIITQTSCGMKTPVQKTTFCLNTAVTVEIDSMTQEEGEKVIDEVFEECRRYENMLSRTVKGSDIYRINHAEGKPVEVSEETAELISESLEVCRQTDGLFDITVGRLTDLWNFSSEDPHVPDDSDIKEAAATVDYRNVSVDGTTVQMKNPDAWIDLGASAKGYIADRLAVFMRDKGVTSGVINLGGNIVTIGEMENDKGPWPVGLEKPYSERQEIIGKLMLQDQTLVTSGVYERCFTENGKTYHHVLNPDTGYPEDTDMLSISILSNEGNSTMCDIYSTSCLLMGSEKARKFMDSKDGFEYAIVMEDGTVIQSDGFNMEE